jgi:signal transduction histidine kinase/ActR/RegA family two-component response regulator
MNKAKGNETHNGVCRGQLETVRQSEEHFRHLFDDSPMALWEEDLSLLKKRIDKIRAGGVASFKDYFAQHPEVVTGCMSTVTITTVNRTALNLFKADRKEFLRYGLAAIYGEKNQEAFSKELLALSEGKSEFEGEVLTHALTGEIKHIIVRWVVPPTYEDTFSKVLVGAFDITERRLQEDDKKQSELQALQVEKLESLSKLSSKLAHDFNNVLMAIFGYSEILMGTLGKESKEYPLIEQVLIAARRAADMTQQLMIMAGKSKPNMAFLDTTQIIEEMQPVLKGRSLIKSILTFDLKSDLPWIEADPIQIRQMLPILLDNAAEAIGDKVGIITVRTGTFECQTSCLRSIHGGENLAPGTYVYVEVADTGAGMDKPTLSQLFVPFFTTKARKGVLDLSTVLGIMKGHGGAVSVISEVGTGTSFKLLFPISKRAVADAKKEKMIIREGWKGTGTILVVDDEPMIRDVLKYMLQDLGFDVLAASDGNSGIETYRKNSKDIVAVLLDLIMPGISSADTFKEIRRINKDACIILSSGASEDLAKAQFPLIEGISGFIRKPYQRQELTDTLYKLLTKQM